MLEPLQVIENKAFVGRSAERQQLISLGESDESAILILYGRRRVGKTELIEQTYAHRNLLKFEGIEGADETVQRQQVLYQLSQYTGNPHYKQVHCNRWVEVFQIISDLTKEGIWTVYFEELQWLANYRHDFIAELKFAWDNQFRYNKKLKLILCGSSPSFMIKQVVYSKALYNRSQTEVHLKPFSVSESQLLLPKRSLREIMDAYLTVGGIPEYLLKIRNESSLYLGICKLSFVTNGFFTHEYKRIFVSSLAGSPHYQEIIKFLSQHRFATRIEIAKHLGITAGGTLSAVLNDLELCGFIENYTPLGTVETKRLSRYEIRDNYLMFYFKFIHPHQKQIANGQYNNAPNHALPQQSYYQWLGYAFERYCRQNSHSIAKILEFSGVHYLSGAYFSRRIDKENPGFQIDLVFERSDRVYTICEIRYTQSPVDVSIIEAFETKMRLFPNPKQWTIHRVLISANGATDALKNYPYFDRIITLEELI